MWELRDGRCFAPALFQSLRSCIHSRVSSSYQLSVRSKGWVCTNGKQLGGFLPKCCENQSALGEMKSQFPPSIFCRLQLGLILPHQQVSQWLPPVRTRERSRWLWVWELQVQVHFSLSLELTFGNACSSVQGGRVCLCWCQSRVIASLMTQMWGPVSPGEDTLSTKPQPSLGPGSRCAYFGPKTARNLSKGNCDICTCLLKMHLRRLSQRLFLNQYWSIRGIICMENN